MLLSNGSRSWSRRRNCSHKYLQISPKGLSDAPEVGAALTRVRGAAPLSPVVGESDLARIGRPMTMGTMRFQCYGLAQMLDSTEPILDCLGRRQVKLVELSSFKWLMIFILPSQSLIAWGWLPRIREGS
jgi:hypothetical protein